MLKEVVTAMRVVTSGTVKRIVVSMSAIVTSSRERPQLKNQTTSLSLIKKRSEQKNEKATMHPETFWRETNAKINHNIK